MSTQTNSIGDGSSSEGIEGLGILAHRAQAYTNASGAAIALPGGTGGELICRARSGSRAPDVGAVLRLEGTFTGLCVQSGKLVRCNDTEAETRVDLAAARSLGVRSLMVAPIGRGGNIRGAFALFSFTPNAFSATHEAVLKTLADEVMTLLAKKAATAAGARAASQLPAENLAAVPNQSREPVEVLPFPKPAETDPPKIPPLQETIRVTAVKPNTNSSPDSNETPVIPAIKVQKATPRRSPGKSMLLVAALIVLLLLGGGLWFTLRPNRAGLALASSMPPTFRIHGSNTLGSDCVPALVKAYLSRLGAKEPQVTPVRKEELMVSAKTGKGQVLGIEIESHGSFTGFKDLAEDKTELAMASTRLPGPASVSGDSADAQAKRATLERLKGLKSSETEYVVGLDGIAIVAAPARAATTSLSKQQVCDIFSGKINNWDHLNPAHPGVIKTYVRDKNSGTRKTFADICYEGKDILPLAAQAFEDSHQLSETVSKDPDAIGFVGLPFVAPANPIAVDGKFPTESSVRLEEYALTRRLYIYRNKRDPSESGYINDFIEFVMSPTGQNIVRQAGFVDQEIKLEEAAPDRNAPRDYAAMTAGARRASLEVRFESSSANMDSKAGRDLARLKKFIEDSHAAAQTILVLGFADKSGSPSRNCAISRERAQLVEDQLHRLGLANTASAGFGPAMPLTSEAGPEGMAKNRRVEIWVTDGPHPYSGAATCP